jgi:nitrosocyanin
MRKIAGVLVAALLAALVLAGCAKSPVHRSIAAVFVAPGPAGFAPATIKVKKGDKVQLTVTNKHDRTHGFSIDAFSVKQTVDPGKPILVKFTARRAGTFEIYCQLHPAHKKASLVVT